jgi:vacuolar-type H+-ATPase subunit E/Vma4
MSETSKFTEDILAVAKEKAQTIVAEAENETQKALQEAKTRLSREADDVIRNAKAEAEGVKRRHMSEVRHKVKLQEQLEKDRILTDVLQQTKKRIADVASDETRYFPYLASSIANAIRELGFEEVLVHLNAKDLKRIDRTKLEREVGKKLDKRVKVEWSKNPIEALGGAIVSNADGKIRIVSTLDQKFEALGSKLLTGAGRTLFGNNA